MANKIKDDYPYDFDIVMKYGDFKIGQMKEDSNFTDFINVNIGDYTIEDTDNFNLSNFIANATPKRIVEMFDTIDKLQEKIKELEKVKYDK